MKEKRDEQRDEQKKSVDIIREYQLFCRREETQPHISYAKEKEGLEIIARGQTDRIGGLMHTRFDGTRGVLSENELRNVKNMLICAVTLYTRAAMEGGLAEEKAYAMSDSYIQCCEKCRNTEELDHLHWQAVREFTSAVAQTGGRTCSAAVEKAVHYIHIHLHEKITLRDAAEAAGFSPYYFSRRFREETGMTFVDYIQKERIEAAESMLVYSDFSIAQISEFLNFSTQSYFIRIFRKYKGVTPGCYRKYRRA